MSRLSGAIRRARSWVNIIMSGLSETTFRSLHSRNYLLFFSGQGISLIGTWMQRIAVGWLIYRLTGSAWLLGIAGFVNQLPTFLLAPIAGVLADRWDKHRILIITQVLSMLQALLLAVLVLTNRVEVWHVLVLGSCLGVINAFDIPVRQSFVVEMIENKADLGNAIALNSTLVNGGRLLGPSIAGILIMLLGEGLCFLVNGLSYIAVIAALLAMTLTAKPSTQSHKNLWKELRDGYQYASGSQPIKAILLLLALVSFVGMPYVMLMPIFAKNILHGNASSMGFLMGANGIGALIGSIFLASRDGHTRLGRWIIAAAVLFGLGLIGFSLSTAYWLSLLLLVVVGFGMMIQMASSNTLLQFIVDDSKRGRVMSFYTMAFMGMAPFGALCGGSLANHLGAPTTVLIGGIGCLLAAAYIARYVKLPDS